MPLLKTELGFRVAYQGLPRGAGVGVAQYAATAEAAVEVRALTTEVLALVGSPRRRRRPGQGDGELSRAGGEQASGASFSSTCR